MTSRPDSRIGRGPISKKKINAEQVAAHQKAGQIAYKKGNLQGAIESFTQVRVGCLFACAALITD